MEKNHQNWIENLNNFKHSYLVMLHTQSQTLTGHENSRNRKMGCMKFGFLAPKVWLNQIVLYWTTVSIVHRHKKPVKLQLRDRKLWKKKKKNSIQTNLDWNGVLSHEWTPTLRHWRKQSLCIFRSTFWISGLLQSFMGVQILHQNQVWIP